MIEVLKELPGFATGVGYVHKKTVVKKGEQHYVVSSATVMFSGFETLVFRCNGEGVTTYPMLEVAGGRGVSHEDAIAELDANPDL